MTTNDLLTFDKTLAPGVTLSIRNIPGRIITGGENDYRKQIVEWKTGARLRELIAAARRRMADGETDIRFDFGEDV